MARTIFPGWSNALAGTKYPFSDAATLKNNDGKSISVDVFADARIHLIGGSGGYFISKIVIDINTITIEIVDVDGKICTAVADTSTSFDSLPLYDIYGRTAGLLVTTPIKITSLKTMGVGTHSFLRNQTEFNSIVAVPINSAGLEGFIDSSNNLVSGETWIIGKNGVVLSNDNGNIRIDITGNPLFKRKQCADNNAAINNAVPIISINNVRPNIYGDFTFTSGTGVSTVSGLRITNKDNNIVIGLFK